MDNLCKSGKCKKAKTEKLRESFMTILMALKVTSKNEMTSYKRFKSKKLFAEWG